MIVELPLLQFISRVSELPHHPFCLAQLCFNLVINLFALTAQLIPSSQHKRLSPPAIPETPHILLHSVLHFRFNDFEKKRKNLVG